MNRPQQTAILIADLGYGDAGKGSIVDYLTRTTNAHTVIRYNGGAQAAHNVVTPDGRHHTFAQFGSGTFIAGTRTYLSRYMMVDPLAMLAEERHLQSLGVADAFPRLSIDRDALITTPFQGAANRLKEIARGGERHGSCGMGIGETMSDWLTHGPQVLFAGDLASRGTVVSKLRFLRDTKIAELEGLPGDLHTVQLARADLKTLYDPEIIERTADLYTYFSGLVSVVDAKALGLLFRQPGTTIFEGAQGVLLDEWHGFYPYNTWSTLTFKNADALLSENAFSGQVLKLGLTRAYATRHGPGPFVTEDESLSARLQDEHNRDNPWQRAFRVGYLDLVALRYALAVTGRLDGLVVTNLDRLVEIPEWCICSRYRYAGARANLADHFQVENGWVSHIRVAADPTDLSRQEQLSRLLMDMRPGYRVFRGGMQAYVEHIGQALSLPIAVISAGPSAREKESCLEKVSNLLAA